MSGADAPRPLRLFVALELPEEVRASLAALGAASDPEVWRPVAPESLHVTLAFLGSRPPGDAELIAPVLEAEAGAPAPRLAQAAALLLPPRRARVLAAGIADVDGTLGELQARVASGLAAAGVYTAEKRAFRAHVTVARLRARAEPPRAAEAQLDAEPFTAGRLTLFRSQLHPTGARYSPLTSVLLAG